MGNMFRILGLTLIATGIWCPHQNLSQEKTVEKTAEKSRDKPAEKANQKPADTAAAPVVKKANPVKSTPEVLAAAKKVFGYDCAMCHGLAGDGKGELVGSMNLTLKDWHTSKVLSGMADDEIYELIIKGKDKMVGEGERLAPAKVWGLVNYVRTLEKK
jgi:mono/diheme cytochrome c family protein